MKKLLLIPLLLLSLTTMAACSTTDDTPDTPSGIGSLLIDFFAYFSPSLYTLGSFCQVQIGRAHV